MFFIPGWLIALATFPGVICHEAAHKLFCDLSGTPVYDACYIRLGNPAGYVIHGPTKNLKSAFLISVGPLIVNTMLCSVITFAAAIPVFILQVAHATLLSILLLWVGMSLGMHAFPSNVDMDGFRSFAHNTQTHGLVRLAAVFFSGLFRIANALRVIWFDLIYAFAIASFLPWLVFGLWGSF